MNTIEIMDRFKYLIYIFFAAAIFVFSPVFAAEVHNSNASHIYEFVATTTNGGSAATPDLPEIPFVNDPMYLSNFGCIEIGAVSSTPYNSNFIDSGCGGSGGTGTASSTIASSSVSFWYHDSGGSAQKLIMNIPSDAYIYEAATTHHMTVFDGTHTWDTGLALGQHPNALGWELITLSYDAGSSLTTAEIDASTTLEATTTFSNQSWPAGQFSKISNLSGGSGLQGGDLADIAFYNNYVLGQTYINSLWNNGIGACVYNDNSGGQCYQLAAGGGGGGGSGVGFGFPSPNSVVTDFRNWVINVSGLTPSSSQGLLTVHYGQNSSSLQFSDSSEFNEFISVNPFPIPKSVSLNPIINLTQTSTWYAYVDYNYGVGDVSSSLVSFEISPTATVPQTSSSVAAGVFSNQPIFISPSSTPSNPYTCSGITDISGCLLNVIYSGAQILFQPSTQATSYLQGGVSAIQGVPPFSLVFAVFNQASTVIANASSSQGVQTLQIVYPEDASTTATITILSSSTLTALLNSDGKATFFNLEDFMMYFALLGLIVMVPYHHFHKVNNAHQIKKA